jgi:hypothetical protein
LHVRGESKKESSFHCVRREYRGVQLHDDKQTCRQQPEANKQPAMAWLGARHV